MTGATTPSTVSPTRARLRVAAGLVASGAVVGLVWALLAPPIHGVVALTRGGDRVKIALGSEADHWFTAAALFHGMLCVLAVVAAVLAWQWRAHRGPAMTAVLSIGAIGAAGAAAGVGALVARWRYGSVDVATAPVSEDRRVHYVTEAPAVFFGHTPLQIALTLLLPAAVIAIVYVLAAVSTPRDDLGAWPPVDDPVVFTDRIGTAADVPPAAR
ncbi:DUF2567 domain-containing protein [Mycobacterium sp. SMC-4]|uniref:DUF2567 domain-containing protein n=1 Tax=Mycobacterium sp. SMC-4 TaxID=2857059 RepID=UPI0021B438F1|nr:DUF2567 domain-containing protein [Mycobacterium sp. SMC-4]UXA20316.1 DUF2567 domain-containing protein [Mycobacterium sp. SMC-4]